MGSNDKRKAYRVTVHEGRNTRVTTVHAGSALEAIELALQNGADTAECGAYTRYR